ncbi:hypothetical protein TUM4644_01130 [Shewanella colwelliana]|uniref:hypothetical protein n=1 Tax=Shewanella colwelliana TaxID=23 RepID=UPI001BBE9528|nr:hypothetical protein [Shewanella colwelliana]GIU16718.1 hypothetical protein TUM4644_01130 [Shewanella colwelliana]
MNIKIPRQWLAIMWVSLSLQLLTGCATSYTEVEASFESDWAQYPYQSDVYLIPSASEALAHRIDFIRQAQHSVDITYLFFE